MTAYEFNCCSNTLQFEILKQAGVCLVTSRSGCIQSYLFSIDSFYVEVVQDPGVGGFTLRSFDDVAQLDPYLPHIDISSMIKP